ncbi:haloacid dehalogenase superfamily, subfamily IA, variant 3 with third motif having DD or ED/beta-phosphoglucomutase family hydrolase [Thermomonospora echinospora]|uniref:Beta-phosphoglucomutase n=1 Tax=Thermomonospora echinospora TaxID=1992 RepID=A0A1H5SZQ6_9ACTN|nr:beta-phosphoglucomutase family hydrolase [Thermomonospora echinospora]SEF55398.1 haloacid dehalogenase superfamily, subfamily IA, variant 3 with third motif having DD or ED/beta-phosphoglucomutase family hydrolase [Thermomonospora echinospora]
MLSSDLQACLFDMDGVLTDTAAVHAAAWKEMFDGFLREWSEREGIPCTPFDLAGDYVEYVDGKRREDGVRSFLASRGIRLPEGRPDGPPEAETVHGLGARKNALLLRLLDERGVGVFPDAVDFVRAVRERGMRTAVVSSSANTVQVLKAADLTDLFDARIDGVVAQERDLPGKPAPDMFLAGAEALGAQPRRAAVFEDALSGVAAGRAGGFGLVVGVDRVGGGHAAALRENGADVVVGDLGELLETR